MSLSLSIQWNFAKIPLVKIEQNNKNPIFQNKNAFFYIWGCCDKKCILQNVYDFTRGFFLYTWLILSQHPQQVFCFFNNIFWGYLANQLFFSIFWVFMHHPSKFGSFSLKIDQEINFQSWPFQTLFWQLNHSALDGCSIMRSGQPLGRS